MSTIGTSRQNFILIDSNQAKQGVLYEKYLLRDEWTEEIENKNKTETTNTLVLFNDNEALDGVKRQVDIDILVSSVIQLDNWEASGLIFDDYKIDKVKDTLLEKSNFYFTNALKYYEESRYEKAIIQSNKALNLNSHFLKCSLLKCELFIELGDIKSAISNINKLYSYFVSLPKPNTSSTELQVNSLEQLVAEKLSMYYYLQAQLFFDCKFYLESLDNYTKASELRPANLVFKIRCVACLVALKRMNEALAFVNKIIEESAENQRNVHLYVLRARLHLKYNNQTLCYYDLRDALLLQPRHKEACGLMKMIEITADTLYNNSKYYCLSNRLNDALQKVNNAIAMNPVKAAYHLQRGIIYKRMKNFNSAIDDFILGLDKLDHQINENVQLYDNLNRQILLTYNDFAMQCFSMKFYDEAILLLNKAIKLEKNEKGFYVNRGDCFYKRLDINYALLDYEQALELDANDVHIKNRIAKINYELATRSHEDKDFKKALEYINTSIKMSPQTCKYYVTRAKILYFLERKDDSQLDICISVLLDPLNPDIPGIISRIFTNQSLGDVLKSPHMRRAQEFLKPLPNLKLNFTENIFNNLQIKPTTSESIKKLAVTSDDAELINLKRNLKKTLKMDYKIKSSDVNLTLPKVTNQKKKR